MPTRATTTENRWQTSEGNVQSKQHSWADEQLEAAAGVAPGAIPPTGGMVPEDARPSHVRTKHHLDELVDALGLLLRAARDLDPARTDPRVSALTTNSEQTIVALQALESGAFNEREHRARMERVAAIAAATRADIAVVVERVLSGIRASLLTRD